MDVFKDKNWLKFRRIDPKYKECLNAFLDYTFATSSSNNKIPCPCLTYVKCVYHERKAESGQLIKKINTNYQKNILAYHKEPTNSEDDGDNDMIDDKFNNENYVLFDHGTDGQ